MSFNIWINCMPSCKAVNLDKNSTVVRADVFSILLEKIVAGIILAVASPMLLIIALLIKLRSDGSVFYRGPRLGEKKKIFNLYKFRTLPSDFQQRHGAKLVSSKDSMPPLFRFLRDSRLDEFPQLLNIIKGDMQFIGPRPERPEVYEEKCKHIKNYDIRFQHRPGLIGYSQIFTPHGTSKRIRTMIDNRFAEKNSFECLSFLFYAATKLTQNMISRCFFLANKYYANSSIAKERRSMERIKQEDSYAYILKKDGNILFLGEIFDANEDFFGVATNLSLERKHVSLMIEKYIQSRNKSKKIIIYCDGEVCAERTGKNKKFSNFIVMRTENVTPLNHYKISRYMLNQGIVN